MRETSEPCKLRGSKAVSGPEVMAAMQSTIGKPQFGPWLIEQVESGRYEGVRMIGNDIFRIPWKHNSRKDLGDEDIKIFKEWAVVSGKINEHPNDKAKWKTNFRCALYSLKNFEMLEDHSKDPDDQHKVYRIIRPQNHQEVQSAEPVQLPLPFISEVFSTNDYMPEDMEQELLSQVETMHLNPQSAETQPWDCSQQNIQTTSRSYFGTPYPDQCMQNNMPDPVQQPYTTAQQWNVPALCDLEISINYRRTEVLKTRLCSSLVQFYYQCDPSELIGEPIRFPTTEGLIDHKQIQFTKRILDSIQRGLQLEVNQYGIYGFRQDKCKVFVSTSDPSEIQNPEPRKLHQNSKEQLFSFDKYIKDLVDFKENRRGSPDYTIYLCFGEKLPDGKPLEKKLITVKVVPLICRELHERAQMEGASSLRDNVSLQISHNSLFDLINSLGLPSMD
ncbi:interferon regulatory factor 7 isoform X2 [Megalobrama amblycephala]|uniref:interferon regulatory factor 7 isoform X2 n=1 Tax=Megalobrama amblycephala TaxID=75352 RepID=UPI00201471BB|nr:interferon regulatory factor 7 isoform X2 [Megalobrama amblycephala]